MTIDASAVGALMNKPYLEACALIENMGQNHYQWGTTHASVEKKVTKGEPPKKIVVTTPEKQVEEPVEPEKQKDEEAKDKEGVKDNKVYIPPPPYKPPIPYPQRLKQTKLDKQYKKFIKVVEIPFTEAIIQIPSYAKFLKDILTNKRNHVIDKALLDLGANVSLMTLAVCNGLNLGEMQPTRTSLQLADRSVKYPIGILKDIIVRIDQLYIPTDFIVMDIKEDNKIPILLSRPLLSTVGVIIDVKRGKMNFEVGDEKVEFILSKFLMEPTMDDLYYAINIIDECIRELNQKEPAETVKLPSTPIMEDDEFKILIEPYIDDNIYECLTSTPDHISCPKKPSIELKELPKNLIYEFLDEGLNCQVTINATLNGDETNKLLDVLRKYPTTLGYNISDLKGISPSM
ncbi:uncharacterized protein LOC127123390 [Lathyrus oleraceus]|uniref:uncharacterized protein LOC127123390 n=1 Tax=Pisum sativum TaxID=3888 RepID=UPI0021D21F20|nr:uncharacterized protein LOC127123390 [Pisum sativum]